MAEARPPIDIRRAELADHDALCELFAEVDAAHSAALPDIFRRVRGPARSRAYLKHLLADPDAALFVAGGAAGGLSGLVDVRAQHTPDVPLVVPRRYALIDTLVVRRGEQRRGIGRALMAAAHGWARERGLQEVMLNVWEFNTGAIAFYESLGYATAMRRMRLQFEGPGEGDEPAADAP